MDLNFLSGLASGEQVASSDNTMNYVVMKTPEGDITFTYEGDDRIEGAFAEYEKIGLITQNDHSELLNTMNTCEWDLKVDFVGGEFKKVERYSPEVKAEMIAKKELDAEKAFYQSEKALALAIEEDYRLGLEPITDEQMAEVKLYIKSIQPITASTAVVLIPRERPLIMEVYEERRENGVL